MPREPAEQAAIDEAVRLLAAMPVETADQEAVCAQALQGYASSLGLSALTLRGLVANARAAAADDARGAAAPDSPRADPAAATTRSSRRGSSKRLQVPSNADVLRFLGDLNAVGRNYATEHPRARPFFFHQNERPVRLSRVSSAEAGFAAEDGGFSFTAFAPAESAWVHNQVERHFEFYVKQKTKSGAWQEKPDGFPGGLLPRLLAAMSDGLAQPVARVVHAPFIHKDGTAVVKKGYHKPSEALCLFSDFTESVPDAPTRDDALAAVQWIRDEVMIDFPFVSDAGRGAFLAFVLHKHLRFYFPVVPAWLVPAPESSSGKDLLVKAATLLATGRVEPEVTWPKEEVEQQKQIIASLAQATYHGHYSNVPNGARIGGAMLDRLVTADVLSDRLLGSSTTVTGRNLFALVFTGNNIGVEGDTTRRVVVSEICPNVEDPGQRTGFRHPNLLTWMRENEKTMRRHMLTLAGYAVQSAKTRSRAADNYVPLATFEVWDRVVRRCIVDLLGDAFDPVSTTRAARKGLFETGDKLIMRTLVDGLLANEVGQFSAAYPGDVRLLHNILLPLLDSTDALARTIVEKWFKETKTQTTLSVVPSAASAASGTLDFQRETVERVTREETVRHLQMGLVGRFLETRENRGSGNHCIRRARDADGDPIKVLAPTRNMTALWRLETRSGAPVFPPNPDAE